MTFPSALVALLSLAVPFETPDWNINPAKYHDSMTMVAFITLDGVRQTTGTLAAFVGDEVRGIAKASDIPVPFGPQKGAYTFDLMMYSNDHDETVTFKFFDQSLGVMPITQSVVFKADDMKGNAVSPFHLSNEQKDP